MNNDESTPSTLSPIKLTITFTIVLLLSLVLFLSLKNGFFDNLSNIFPLFTSYDYFNDALFILPGFVFGIILKEKLVKYSTILIAMLTTAYLIAAFILVDGHLGYALVIHSLFLVILFIIGVLLAKFFHIIPKAAKIVVSIIGILLITTSLFIIPRPEVTLRIEPIKEVYEAGDVVTFIISITNTGIISYDRNGTRGKIISKSADDYMDWGVGPRPYRIESGETKTSEQTFQLIVGEDEGMIMDGMRQIKLNVGENIIYSTWDFEILKSNEIVIIAK